MLNQWILGNGLALAAAAGLMSLSGGVEVGTAFCFGTVCPCGNVDATTGGGCANSTGVGGRLWAHGGTSVSADDMVIEARQLPPAKVSLIIACRSVRDVKYGDGRLCIGPQMSRLWGHMNTSQAGTITRDHVISTYIAYGTPMAAGETWNFQLWYRDPVPTWGCPNTKPANGTNLTNAYSVILTP